MLTVVISKLWNFEYFSPSYFWSVSFEVFTVSTFPCCRSWRRQTCIGSSSASLVTPRIRQLPSSLAHPSPLHALPIVLWAPQNSGSYTQWLNAMEALPRLHSQLHGKPTHPWRLSSGSFPSWMLSPALSAGSVSLLWSSQFPIQVLISCCTCMSSLSMSYLGIGTMHSSVYLQYFEQSLA